MTPEKPSWSASRYAPYARTTVMVNSMRWSPTDPMTLAAAKPVASPIATLTTTIPTNDVDRLRAG